MGTVNCALMLMTSTGTLRSRAVYEMSYFSCNMTPAWDLLIAFTMASQMQQPETSGTVIHAYTVSSTDRIAMAHTKSVEHAWSGDFQRTSKHTSLAWGQGLHCQPQESCAAHSRASLSPPDRIRLLLAPQGPPQHKRAKCPAAMPCQACQSASTTWCQGDE